MVILNALVLPRNAHQQRLRVLSLWRSLRDRRFFFGNCCRGQNQPGNKKKKSDARSRIIGLSLFDALLETSLRLLPDPGAVHRARGSPSPRCRMMSVFANPSLVMDCKIWPMSADFARQGGFCRCRLRVGRKWAILAVCE